MIVCPVCEHQQPQGADCEVCGKRLLTGAAAAAATTVVAVEGLEPTLHAPIDAGEVALVELEPTLHAAAGPVAWDATPDMEATSAAPVDVDVSPTPDVERTAAEIPGDARTVLPALPICRYCRTQAMPDDRICTRCGMRLAVTTAAAAEGAGAPPRHCSCGTLVRAGAALCPTCGARLA